MADTRQTVFNGGGSVPTGNNGLTPEVDSTQIWNEDGKKWNIPTIATEASLPGFQYPVYMPPRPEPQPEQEPELEEDYIPLGGIEGNYVQPPGEPAPAYEQNKNPYGPLPAPVLKEEEGGGGGLIIPNPEKTGGLIIPDNKSESSYSSSTSESSERLTKKYLRLISGLNISGKNKLLAVQIILALFAATGVAIVDSGATDIIRGLRIVRNGNCDSVVYKYGELEKMIPCKLKGLLIILRGVGVASIIPNVLDDIVYLASKTRGWVTGPGGDIKPPEGWP